MSNRLFGVNASNGANVYRFIVAADNEAHATKRINDTHPALTVLLVTEWRDMHTGILLDHVERI